MWQGDDFYTVVYGILCVRAVYLCCCSLFVQAVVRSSIQKEANLLHGTHAVAFFMRAVYICCYCLFVEAIDRLQQRSLFQQKIV